MAGTVELTTSRLSAPARESVRVIAGERLAEVESAFAALQARHDASFHDVRVALRRLRSLLRAFRPELSDTLRGKTRRRFRDLAHATNPVRDAEVMLEWIAGETLSNRRELPGQRHLAERIEQERAAAADEARATLDRRLPKAMSELSKALRGYTEHHAIDHDRAAPSMGIAMAQALVNAMEHFSRASERAETSGDAAQFHRVRIAGKRLRYLLELLAHDPDASALVERLAAMQDCLGHAHDMHETAHRIVRELGELAARDGRLAGLRAIGADEAAREPMRFARLRPGLVALAARAHREESNAIAAFRADWNRATLDAMRASVDAVRASLSAA